MYYRSRLQKVEEKQNLRKATLLIGGTVLLIIIAVVAGIPLLVRLANIITDVSSANRPITKTDNVPPVPPLFDIPYDATNSAEIDISGRAEAGSTVALTLNDKSIDSVVVNEEGQFQFNQVELDQGENFLVAAASDQAGNTSKLSETATVFYSHKAPEITVESPTDHQAINAKDVEIKGQISSGSRLTINDRTVIVNSEGKFTTKFNLNSGENVLVLIAIDKAGNRARHELTVVSTQ